MWEGVRNDKELRRELCGCERSSVKDTATEEEEEDTGQMPRPPQRYT